MTHETIKAEVRNAILNWVKTSQSPFVPKIELSRGAQELLIQMIINIEDDPSPHWQDVDKEAAQKYAVSIIPNVLNGLRHSGTEPRRGPRHSPYPRHASEQHYTSWELLHRMSVILDEWCFIPKDL